MQDAKTSCAIPGMRGFVTRGSAANVGTFVAQSAPSPVVCESRNTPRSKLCFAHASFNKLGTSMSRLGLSFSVAQVFQRTPLRFYLHEHLVRWSGSRRHVVQCARHDRVRALQGREDGPKALRRREGLSALGLSCQRDRAAPEADAGSAGHSLACRRVSLLVRPKCSKSLSIESDYL